MASSGRMSDHFVGTIKPDALRDKRSEPKSAPLAQRELSNPVGCALPVCDWKRSGKASNGRWLSESGLVDCSASFQIKLDAAPRGMVIFIRWPWCGKNKVNRPGFTGDGLVRRGSLAGLSKMVWVGDVLDGGDHATLDTEFGVDDLHHWRQVVAVQLATCTE